MRKVLLITTLLIISFVNDSNGQLQNFLFPDNMDHFSWKEVELSKSKDEKLTLLSKGKPDLQNLLFENPYYDEKSDEPQDAFFPLDTAGLHFIDLNGDAKTDLIYEALSGSMARKSIKIFINQDDQLRFKNLTEGSVVKIEQEKNASIFIYNGPCCDSYTHSFKELAIKNHDVIQEENVVFITDTKIDTSGTVIKPYYPALLKKKKKNLSNWSLYISPFDLRGGAYFKGKTKEIIGALRAKEYVKSGQLGENIRGSIFDTKVHNGETYYLVLTDNISDISESLFEQWQTRDFKSSRYLSWAKKD